MSNSFIHLQLTHLFEIPANETVEIAPFFEYLILKPNNFYLKKGEEDAKLGFVKSGILKMYDYYNHKEITEWIATPNLFVTDLNSLLFDVPNRWNIQAITDCELFSISKENYISLKKSFADWDKYENTFLSKCMITMENRIFNHLAMSAEERYTYYFNAFPEVFNHVQLQDIASSLGMTPETLSRIRRKQMGE